MNADNAVPIRRTRSLWALMTTQFFGAFNDNVFQIAVALLIVQWMDPKTAKTYVAVSGAVFAAPFLMFSLAAGRLADRWSKAKVVLVTKCFDLAVVAVAITGLYLKSPHMLLVSLFLLAVQSAFFAPAKYGLLPELVPEAELPRANGILNVASFTAILTGTIAGALMTRNLHAIAATAAVMAVGSFLGAFMIDKVPAANPEQPLMWNPLPEFVDNWRLVRENRPLKLSLLAVAGFWFLGGVFHLNTLVYVKQVMHLSDKVSGLFLTALVIGIAGGSLLAGRMSEGKIELGLVPLGAVGMSFFTLDLYFSHHSLIRTLADAGLLGVSAGLFLVPLNTLIQVRSPEKERGRVLALSNFLSFIAIFLASGFLWVVGSLFNADPAQTFLTLAVISFMATVTLLIYLPQSFLRLLLYFLTNVVYKIKVVGAENVPLKGPAILVPNHVGMVDPFLIGGALSRSIRFMMYRDFYDKTWIRPFVRLMDAIPVSNHDGPKEIVRSLLRARKKLEEGHVVCIFAEGALTRVGQTQGFKKGFETVARGMDVPVIPVHLDRVWGSIFSFARGKFIWKMPRELPYPVTVTFGKPLPSKATADQARQAVLELGSDAFAGRLAKLKPLHQAFFRIARRQWTSPALRDTNGLKLSYGKAATGSLLLGRRFARAFSEKNIGILLPSCVPGAVVNLALLFAGKVPVNLNYSLGRSVIDQICEDAGISHILTSRKMLEALKWGGDPRMVFLEDMPRAPKALAAAFFILFRGLPARWVEKIFAPHSDAGMDDLAALLFTSGSTGRPKGVMLTHGNIHSNIQGLQETYQLTSKDVLLGVLPLFHSFGFTGTLWLPLLTGSQVAYHRSPLEPVAVRKLIIDAGVTVLLATPTFLQMWMKKLEDGDLKKVRFVFTGAEKLQPAFAREFTQKFGVPILEGYGTTELSPAACVSALDVDDGAEHQVGHKLGKVGRPLPGVSVRIVNPDTGAAAGENQPGLLLVKGPNVMKGYWNDPEKTAEVMRGGWYVTGDIAHVDEDGFVEITDRLSRFSKIGGEMVPHMLVEQKLSELSGEPDARFLVLSFTDETRGEKLVVLASHLGQDVDALLEKANKSGMPKLWIPGKKEIFRIPEIPALASGKTDMVKAKAQAKEFLRG